MLPVKSKFKIAKRLGAHIFEKTQSQKFALSEARAKKPRRGTASDFGKQLLEKQRVRYTYGLSESQLSKYAAGAILEKDPQTSLHHALEMRADSIAYRSGLAPTRRAARQAVSHGHFTVNGRRITVPSHRLKKSDVLAVRTRVAKSPLYASLTDSEHASARAIPNWLAVDLGTLKAEVKGEPVYNVAEAGLDYATVFEFYSR